MDNLDSLKGRRYLDSRAAALKSSFTLGEFTRAYVEASVAAAERGLSSSAFKKAVVHEVADKMGMSYAEVGRGVEGCCSLYDLFGQEMLRGGNGSPFGDVCGSQVTMRLDGLGEFVIEQIVDFILSRQGEELGNRVQRVLTNRVCADIVYLIF